MDRLDFSEAIDFLAAKTNLDTNDWQEGQGVTQLSAFTVASAKGSLLQDIRDTLDRSIAQGEDLQGFLKRFTLLENRWTGANAWRGTLIYETNVRAAYGAGRLEQLNEVKDSRPYWQWRHGNSPEPRPEHLKMDGKVFRADDVDIALPYGFFCRCQFFSLSERELKKSGLSVSRWKRPPEEKGWADRRDIEKRIADLKLDKELKKLIAEESNGS
jgi:SPP1 gp7 family putative phage head morphogenesis protein